MREFARLSSWSYYVTLYMNKKSEESKRSQKRPVDNPCIDLYFKKRDQTVQITFRQYPKANVSSQ